MGDRLATIDMAEKLGGCCARFHGRELGPTLTQCRLSQDLPSYQVVSWSIQPFYHNRHGPKSGGLLGRHLTQCRLGRDLPLYQVASWSITTVWPQYTNITDRQDTLLVTVAQKSISIWQSCRHEYTSAMQWPVFAPTCRPIMWYLTNIRMCYMSTFTRKHGTWPVYSRPNDDTIDVQKLRKEKATQFTADVIIKWFDMKANRNFIYVMYSECQYFSTPLLDAGHWVSCCNTGCMNAWMGSRLQNCSMYIAYWNNSISNYVTSFVYNNRQWISVFTG